jgi:hypothetical protein
MLGNLTEDELEYLLYLERKHRNRAHWRRDEW